MKFNIIIYLVFFLVISFNLRAQLDRTKKPEPGPAPEIEIADYESFQLPNGLKVFVVENHKLPKVSFSLVVDRDPIMEGNKAGYLSITGELLSAGTKSRTKAQLDEEIDFIGASFSASSSGMYGSSLKKHTEKLLEIMTDVLLNPSFPQEELEKIKKQTLSVLALEKDDPDAIANKVLQALVYGKNHPYGEITTEETVKNITVQDSKDYYQKFFRPNISYLAIVGDVNLKEAKALAKKYFGKWQKGEVPKFSYKDPELPEKRVVAVVDRGNSVQSVLKLGHPVELQPNDPDVIKSRLMNEILGGSFTSRLNMNLREKHGFTYGARSGVSADKLIGSFTTSTKVRNEVTDSAIAEIFKEISLLEKENVKPEELQSAKNYLTGSFARSLENPQTIASFAINTARYNLPEDYYANYLKNLQNVTIDDVQQMAKKYVKPERLYLIVVGKSDEIGKNLDKYGEVKFFDIYGNEVQKSSSIIPKDITPEQVYDKYINALGGEENVSKINDITIKMTMNTQGMDFHFVKYDKKPNKTLMIGKMGENEIMKMAFDGTKGYQSQMGQREDYKGTKLEDSKIENTLFYELDPAKYGIKLEMKELAKVGEKEAYKIEMTTPSGSKTIQYFDTETGLKLKEEKVEETPQGPVTQVSTFSDYKEVNGVKFPFSISQTTGPMSFDITVTAVEVNKGLEDGLFKVE